MEGQPRTSADEPHVVVVEGQTATLHCHVNGKATAPQAKRCHDNGGFPVSGPGRSQSWGRSHICPQSKLSPGFPAPVTTWSKLRSPLPWRHKVVNNSLVLPNVGRQDSGEYICRATNSVGSSQVTIKLDVESELWDVGVR